MKKILYAALAATPLLLTTGCIEEIDPQSSTATSNQVAEAPNAFNNFVTDITNSITGKFPYWPSQKYPFDYGYTSFYLCRDVMGQDIALTYTGSWYSTWAYASTGIFPGYDVCQMPWTDFYSWIKSCNSVIQLYKEAPEASKASGVGIAHTMRALYYIDLAQMYADKFYTEDPQAPTVPLVTEKTSMDDSYHNPRATNEMLFKFIIEDLDAAEGFLADYRPSDVYTPDLSVVYGLKARAYLLMGKWAKAEEYAKKAQNGHAMMTEDEYLNTETGFNTPNSSWMFGTIFKADDPNILINDADSSWGSIVALESTSECGYASSYGHQLAIDYHLYNTIPESDFRRRCWLDFDAVANEDLQYIADHYTGGDMERARVILNTPNDKEIHYGIAGSTIKFRMAGGAAGRANQYIGFLMAVPLMRVEEMKLIEAEAAGMQNEARGKQLLIDFAKTRDPEFVYGMHQETYGNPNNTAFQNEIWWQRRVELWGEGFATNDIKRFRKGIIRSYEGTNHMPQYQWNSPTTPQWMTFFIGGTEPSYNYDLEQNPMFTTPVGDSEPTADFNTPTTLP